jgi:hypothetical protein
MKSSGWKLEVRSWQPIQKLIADRPNLKLETSNQ